MDPPKKTTTTTIISPDHFYMEKRERREKEKGKGKTPTPPLHLSNLHFSSLSLLFSHFSLLLLFSPFSLLVLFFFPRACFSPRTWSEITSPSPHFLLFFREKRQKNERREGEEEGKRRRGRLGLLMIEGVFVLCVGSFPQERGGERNAVRAPSR